MGFPLQKCRMSKSESLPSRFFSCIFMQTFLDESDRYGHFIFFTVLCIFVVQFFCYTCIRYVLFWTYRVLIDTTQDINLSVRPPWERESLTKDTSLILSIRKLLPRRTYMKIGIITRKQKSWTSIQLREAMVRQNVTPIFFPFQNFVARVGYKPENSVDGFNIFEDLSALIVRPVPPGSLEEIIFRINVLHRLERLGMLIVNPPSSIEKCVDKYHALTFLEEAGLPVPRTAVTEDYEAALKAFYELGGDVIVKPLFGSRGIGCTRISDANIATRIFRTISLYHGVIYLQEYVPHGVSDIRVFVVGGRVVAAMRRVAKSWKTNVSQGATPVPLKLSEELEELALKACNVVDCKVAGVDILNGANAAFIVELNSQPGWRGIQSVTEVNVADEIVRFVLSELKR